MNVRRLVLSITVAQLVWQMVVPASAKPPERDDVPVEGGQGSHRGDAGTSAGDAGPSPGDAGAPTSDPVRRAAELRRLGDEAMDAFWYEDALRYYRAAFELTRDPALLYNLGRLQQARGDYPEALRHLTSFAAEAPLSVRAKVPRLEELIAEVRKRVAYLTLRCNVEGARILVDDHVVGRAPVVSLPLRAGQSTVEVLATDHLPYRRVVPLSGGSTTDLDVRLTPVGRAGLLRVRTTGGAEATIAVDGRSVGQAPIEVSVEPGVHLVSARGPSGPEAQVRLVLQRGEHKDVTLEVRSSTPLYQRWSFWAGAGVVLATGTALLVHAIGSEQSPSEGERFSPGRISVPLGAF